MISMLNVFPIKMLLASLLMSLSVIACRKPSSHPVIKFICFILFFEYELFTCKIICSYYVGNVKQHRNTPKVYINTKNPRYKRQLLAGENLNNVAKIRLHSCYMLQHMYKIID